MDYYLDVHDVRRLNRLRAQFPTASDETLYRFMDLRDEGYSMEQAKLMAGLSDPPEEN